MYDPAAALATAPLLACRQIADIFMNLTLFVATFAIAFDTMPRLAAVMLACETIGCCCAAAAAAAAAATVSARFPCTTFVFPVPIASAMHPCY